MIDIDIVKRGYFDTSDKIDFKGINHILKLLGYNVSNWQKGHKVLDDGSYLWIPWRMDCMKKDCDFYDSISADEVTITETLLNSEFNDEYNVGHQRIVFMHIKNENSKPITKFLGVYTLVSNSSHIRKYERTTTRVSIPTLLAK